jgi:chromosome segregation protein
MRIKQIELIGFKSFAEKTVFPLHAGITCIVGPNGCGKSNVVDAFRWVLGEQSAKSLRGEKMEEVIFQGSATKKQKGMAEVTLILCQSGRSSQKDLSENGNGSEGGVPDETFVTRRLYRSGESEYLLNKRQCRLKDIRDIFLDTGLDVKSYSILDQGRIGEIINTKPHDRRFLIEEIAGVMKYKVRKAEAISKLESSKQNLQRINDIIYEVKRQINSLDRLVKKAERYKRLIEELKILELRIAKKRHIQLSDILNSLLSEIDTLKESDSLKRGELSTLENFIETRRLKLVDKEQAVLSLERSLLEKEKKISDSEKRVAVLKAQIENKKTDITRLITMLEETKIKKEALLAKITEIDDTETALLSNIENISTELNERKDRIADIEMTILDKESSIEHKRKEMFSISENLSNKKNELHRLQSSFETLKYRESTSIKDMESIKKTIKDIENAIKEAEIEAKTKIDEKLILMSEKETLTYEITQLKEQIESKKTLLSKEREDLASNIARFDSLKEMIFNKSLMDFITGGQDFWVLSDMITANKDYEIAIEAVLSEKVNSLIINNTEDIISVMNIIKEKNLGRTAMLYTGIMNHGSVDRSLNSELIIGKASDFVTIENSEAQKIVDRIFENIYIVKDICSAFEILNSELHALNSEFILVTLNGEVLSSDGWLFAGHGKDILKRKREIKELQKIIVSQQAAIKDAEDKVNALSDDLTAKKESLKYREDSIVEIEKKISLINHSLRNQQDGLERNMRRLSFLETEISTISQEIESISNFVQIKTDDINALEQQKAEIDKSITSMQESLSSIKAEHEDARSHITDIKLSLASYKEKIEAMQRERNNINYAIHEIKDKEEQAIKELKESEEKINESLAELQMLDAEIKSAVVEADGMQTERAKLRDAVSFENQELLSKGSIVKDIRAEIDEISKKLSELSSNAIENRLRIENIEKLTFQKYGLDIKEEQIESEGFDAAEEEDKINKLNEAMRELGPVNLGTIEEYEELKTRYDFLIKQQQDLTMSIAELEEAISRINSTTRRKLKEAYDSLRIKFSDVFNTLFGGGKADIILTDENNILESGLDIIAQPPGKKLQNINLLSGGEKALTSLALLFAGFLIKPSPLCLLDEADAPLDESNTVRFAQMIKTLSTETQFIIITHNKATMEVADYLYGITMEDPGSSKTISLQFTDIESLN